MSSGSVRQAQPDISGVDGSRKPGSSPEQDPDYIPLCWKPPVRRQAAAMVWPE